MTDYDPHKKMIGRWIFKHQVMPDAGLNFDYRGKFIVWLETTDDGVPLPLGNHPANPSIEEEHAIGQNKINER